MKKNSTVPEGCSKTYLRVIDYKSGGKDFVLSDVLSGLNMQMLIYLFASGENGEEKYGDVFPSGVLYMPGLLYTSRDICSPQHKNAKQLEKRA